MQNKYGVIAEEYYNHKLHPTCADFGNASLALFERHIGTHPLHGVVVEVGAGMSTLLKISGQFGVDRLVVTDSSQEMLRHSEERFPRLAEFVVCDAENIAKRITNIDYIFSSLGDPYNTDDFWKSAYNGLNDNGAVFFTTPSWDWARRFRKAHASEREGYALFVTGRGEQLYVCSDIRPEDEQSAMISMAGLAVREISHVTTSDLRARIGSVSPKLEFLPEGTPIVTGYYATKSPNSD